MYFNVNGETCERLKMQQMEGASNRGKVLRRLEGIGALGGEVLFLKVVIVRVDKVRFLNYKKPTTTLPEQVSQRHCRWFFP